jgi:AhpC/TSA family
MLRVRQLIPPLTLRTAQGRTIRAGDFKQKKNLVVAFLDANCALCDEFLSQFAARAADLRGKETVALVAYLDAPPLSIAESLPEEIIAGADMPGRAARAFLGDDAFSARGLVRGGIFVADRYGELFAQWAIARHEFPAADEIFGWLDQIEMACEECSTPLWPAES